MILLDTHVLIWGVEGGKQLGKSARQTLENRENLIYSAISAWEIAMLVSKDRIRLTTEPAVLLERVRIESGVLEVAVSGLIALDAGSMSSMIHGDPANRIVMATARVFDCPILTADEKILRYAADGHVRAIDARR